MGQGGRIRWQRCATHFYRNVLNAVPRGKRKPVAAALKAIHASEDRAAAEQKAALVAEKLAAMRLDNAARIVREGAGETFSYYAFPREHWRSLRTNNPMERIIVSVRAGPCCVLVFAAVSLAFCGVHLLARGWSWVGWFRRWFGRGGGRLWSVGVRRA
jgi:transposase-like protein